ncbi:hypothetical protein [Stutzerimonas stutzeri]|uniref:hypothetical protein n=1 Tax=Stutzerimonas stutzeri TaxID=316 RepID=UPI0015E31CD3|nr:hypothetical protein [Stutzerimonas stutzeri]MBA1280395.1 hypothetical protein [Stutzerimonas stutzeri]
MTAIHPISTTDRLKNMGLSPDVWLRVGLLTNNLRLAEDETELAIEIARAGGFLDGLFVGNAISETQHKQVQGLFDQIAQRTRSQHAALA